jgi:hypothetical protein
MPAMPFKMTNRTMRDTPSAEAPSASLDRRNSSRDLTESLLEEASQKSLQIAQLSMALEDISRHPADAAKTAALALGALKVWEQDHKLQDSKDATDPWQIHIRSYDMPTGATAAQAFLTTPGSQVDQLLHSALADSAFDEEGRANARTAALQQVEQWSMYFREGMQKAAPQRQVSIEVQDEPRPAPSAPLQASPSP